MHEAIQKVLESEQQAKQMVEDAKRQAVQILSVAQTEAQDLVKQARMEAQNEAARIVEVMVQAAEQAKRERLASITAEIETEVSIDKTSTEQAIVGVIRCVSGQC